MLPILFRDLRRHSPGTGPTLAALIWNALTRPGLLATVLLRLQERLVARRMLAPAKLVRTVCVMLTGADFVPGCRVGPGLYLPHPAAIVIGGEVRVGRDATIHQGVTLGERPAEGRGTGSPIVEDGAFIGAGAVVVGPVRIGGKSRIGANAVVLHDVPHGATVVGAPARVVGTSSTA